MLQISSGCQHRVQRSLDLQNVFSLKVYLLPSYQQERSNVETDTESLAKAKATLQLLITCETFLVLLEQVFPFLAYSHSRGVVTSALQAINASPDDMHPTAPANTLLVLGCMHRAAMHENVLLKFSDPSAKGGISTGAEGPLISPAPEASPVIPTTSSALSLGGPTVSKQNTAQIAHNAHYVRKIVSQNARAVSGFFGGLLHLGLRTAHVLICAACCRTDRSTTTTATSRRNISS